MKNKIIKGLIGGLAAGIVATGIKTVWEKSFPARAKSTDSPPLILADRAKRAAGYKGISENEKPSIEKAIHWTFGISTCVFYSLLAEKYPAVKSGSGLLFGIALYGATHGSVLPALDTEPWFFENKPEYALSEFGSHLAFGTSAEIVRSLVSGNLNKK